MFLMLDSFCVQTWLFKKRKKKKEKKRKERKKVFWFLSVGKQTEYTSLNRECV